MARFFCKFVLVHHKTGAFYHIFASLSRHIPDKWREIWRDKFFPCR
jgi:hypothetical protein